MFVFHRDVNIRFTRKRTDEKQGKNNVKNNIKKEEQQQEGKNRFVRMKGNRSFKKRKNWIRKWKKNIIKKKTGDEEMKIRI